MLFLCVLLALTVTIKGYCHDLNICRKHGSDRGLASHYFYKACTCNAGYARECCEAEKNECESFPCMNGGTCTDLFNDYTCTCLTGDSGKNCEFHYDITDSPRIILPFIKVISEGTNLVKIPCFAEGIPIPHVTWEAVDGNLPSNVKQIAHYLIIQNVTVTDTAFYSCTAKNRDGVDIKVVHVLVNAIQPSLVAPVITVPQNLIVKYYTEAEVVCKATGNPKPDIKWEYDHNRNVSAVLISGGTLRIPNATNVASGLYTCIASNDAGSAKAFVRLEVVHDPPSIVFPPQPFGGSAGVPQNFTCEASGHPHPRITWTFTSFSHQTSGLPPHTLFQNGEVLEISNVQESGTVACEAINEFGKDTASASIIVHHDTAVVG